MKKLLPDIPVGTARGASEAGWHQIADKLACAKLFQLRHVRGIVVPSALMPDPLAIGVLFHAGRARWFSKRFATTQATWDSITEAVETEAQLMDPPCSQRAREEALKLLHLYVDHWSTRPHPKTVAAEYTIGPASLMDGQAFSFRTARLDDCGVYDGVMAIGESKTTSSGIPDVINEYSLHGQILMQALLWKRAPQGEALHGPAKGVMLDVIKKPDKTHKAQFARHLILVTDHSLKWFAKNMVHDLREAAAIDWNSDVRRNVTSCTRQIGRMRVPCPMRELCSMGKSASANYLFASGKSLLSWKPSDSQTVPPWE